MEYQLQARFEGRIFSTGGSFEVGDVVVDTFTIPHDASDPVGFLLRTTAGKIGFLTDLGHATKLALERVRAANVLVLEANHDLKMLQESGRPWSLKQRIAGRHGHLVERGGGGGGGGNHVGGVAASLPWAFEPRMQPARSLRIR